MSKHRCHIPCSARQGPYDWGNSCGAHQSRAIPVPTIRKDCSRTIKSFLTEPRGGGDYCALAPVNRVNRTGTGAQPVWLRAPEHSETKVPPSPSDRASHCRGGSHEACVSSSHAYLSSAQSISISVQSRHAGAGRVLGRGLLLAHLVLLSSHGCASFAGFRQACCSKKCPQARPRNRGIVSTM